MKEQKNIFGISVTVALITLLLSVAGEWHWDRSAISILSEHREYFINLNMGIFAGAGLAAATSYITYGSLKRKAGINYWLSLESFIQKTEVWAFNQFENVLSTSQGVENVKKSDTIVSEVLDLELAYVQLVQEKGELDFINNKSALAKAIQVAHEEVETVHIETENVKKVRVLRNELKESPDYISDEKARKSVEPFCNGESKSIVELKKKSHEIAGMLKITVSTDGVPEENANKSSERHIHCY